MNTELLNKVVGYLASEDVAVENTRKFRHAVIGLTIHTLHEIGLSLQEAMDYVFEAGIYQDMISEIYRQMREQSEETMSQTSTKASFKLDRKTRVMQLIDLETGEVYVERTIPEPRRRTAYMFDYSGITKIRAEIARIARERNIEIV